MTTAALVKFDVDIIKARIAHHKRIISYTIDSIKTNTQPEHVIDVGGLIADVQVRISECMCILDGLGIITGDNPSVVTEGEEVEEFSIIAYSQHYLLGSSPVKFKGTYREALKRAHPDMLGITMLNCDYIRVEVSTFDSETGKSIIWVVKRWHYRDGDLFEYTGGQLNTD